MYFFNLCKKFRTSNESEFKKESIYKNKPSRILILTDLHHDVPSEHFRLLENLEYDVCLLLGDIKPSNLRQIKNIIPSKKLYGVLGNHVDLDLYQKYGIKELSINEPTYIRGEGSDLSIIGLSGSYRYKKCNQCMITPEESLEKCKTAPAEFDLFVSHDYPVNFYDPEYLDDAHPGLEGINYILNSENHPEVMLHGHSHRESVKTYKGLYGNTTVIELYGCSLIELKEKKIQKIF